MPAMAEGPARVTRPHCCWMAGCWWPEAGRRFFGAKGPCRPLPTCTTRGADPDETGSIRYTSAMISRRLSCSSFWVDVRPRELNARWIASTDKPDGPSLGIGEGAIEAVEEALAPFDGIVDELLASLPRAAIG